MPKAPPKKEERMYPPHSPFYDFPSRSARFDSTNYNNISCTCQLSESSTSFSEEKELVKKFTPKKIDSNLLSDSYRRLSLHSRADRVLSCGSFLEFAHEVSEYGELSLKGKLVFANFCKDRLCPMCSWRRSYKIFAQVSQIMDVIGSNYKFLFLTLTVRNVKSEELQKTIDKLMSSWHRFIDYKSVKKVMIGYFRALEITYNKTEDTFHPHFHCVLAVSKSYCSSRDYLSHDDWLNLWRRAYRDDSITQVDIRMARQKKTKDMIEAQNSLSSAVAEIAKYAVKSSDYIFADDNVMTDYLVRTFLEALYHRRLVQFGGIFKDTFKSLKFDDIEADDADLINISGSLNPDLAWLIVRHEWGIGCYRKTFERLELPEEHKKNRRCNYIGL